MIREKKEERREEILLDVLAVVNVKDRNYNSAFEQGVKEFGDISFCIRLNDKLKRATSLIKAKEAGESIDTQGEALKDTITDIIGYSLNFLEIITREEEENKVGE